MSKKQKKSKRRSKKHLIVSGSVVTCAAIPALAQSPNDLGTTLPAPEACTADVNLDGRVDVNDFIAVITGLGNVSDPASPLPTDVTRDGIVGIEDVQATVDQWNSSCADDSGVAMSQAGTKTSKKKVTKKKTKKKATRKKVAKKKTKKKATKKKTAHVTVERDVMYAKVRSSARKLVV